MKHQEEKKSSNNEPCSCFDKRFIKQLTTNHGIVYACERCGHHWGKTYEEIRLEAKP